MIPFTIYFSLLFIGGITFWLLVESKVSVFFKMLMTSLFCLFTVGIFISLQTFLGWGASDKDLPEKVTIVGVHVKEPNPMLQVKGSIYITVDSLKSKYDNQFFKLFGYQTERSEPRMFKLPYSRKLHEQLQESVIPKLQKGQSVTGKLKKGDGENNGGKPGQGQKKGDGKGFDGAESLEQEYQFHNLVPGEIQPKTPEIQTQK